MRMGKSERVSSILIHTLSRFGKTERERERKRDEEIEIKAPLVASNDVSW